MLYICGGLAVLRVEIAPVNSCHDLLVVIEFIYLSIFYSVYIPSSSLQVSRYVLVYDTDHWAELSLVRHYW